VSLKELEGYNFTVATFNAEGHQGMDRGKHFIAKPPNFLYENTNNINDNVFFIYYSSCFIF
jgi:hypothetical protein